jgi:hypothetical protein
VRDIRERCEGDHEHADREDESDQEWKVVVDLADFSG